jgi:4-methyl-5(b-hydroxyethyl)-thiazole monophosphate biosynthesis
MKKIAVILANGFEEIEALTVVDILKRAGFVCDMVSTTDKMVVSTHGIRVEADKLIGETDKDSYDMIVLPGGQPGANNLAKSDEVISWVRDFNNKGKAIGAICAAPLVLSVSGVVNNKKVTSYPSSSFNELFKDSIYTEDLVVVDDNIITSRGPATALPFAYTLVDKLGSSSDSLKRDMLYSDLCEDIKKDK